MKIYIVIECLQEFETQNIFVTTDYDKACKCLDEDLEYRFIEVWEDGGKEGKRLD